MVCHCTENHWSSLCVTLGIEMCSPLAPFQFMDVYCVMKLIVTHCLRCWITGVVLCTDFITTSLFMSNKLMKLHTEWMICCACSCMPVWVISALTISASCPLKNDGNSSDYWNCQNLPDVMWDKFSSISSVWFSLLTKYLPTRDKWILSPVFYAPFNMDF